MVRFNKVSIVFFLFKCQLSFPTSAAILSDYGRPDRSRSAFLYSAFVHTKHLLKCAHIS